MKKTVKYYFSPMSCWTYLGHERFHQIVKETDTTVVLKPFAPLTLFAAAGGLPLAERPEQRQKYRLVELRRWKDYLNSPITIEPKYFPYDPKTASLAIIATNKIFGQDDAMRLTQKLLEGCWVNNKDMALIDEVKNCLEECSINSDKIFTVIDEDNIGSAYDTNTEEAINDSVFGAPTFIIDDEPFWGQDRLDFVERKLKG
jgi:2-hydroxychromene-2-carboxylate isomerase